MSGYTKQTVRWDVEVQPHAIRRFRERFLGKNYRSRNSISIEIARIIHNLLIFAFPYAKAQHNKIVFLSYWYDDKDMSEREVFMVIDFSPKKGGVILRTVFNEEIAQVYLDRGTWKLMWPNGGRE